MSELKLTNKRLPALDGLRALSIGLVVLGHAHSAGYFSAHEKMLGMSLSFLGRAAQIGVDVFFVISGFLITTLLINERQRYNRIDIGAFYRRRAFRVLPAYLFFVGSMAAVSALDFIDLGWSNIWPSLLFVANYVNPGWTTGHTWSLSLEEQFYLLWPLAFVLSGRRVLAGLAIFVMLAPSIRAFDSVCGCWPTVQWSAFETRGDAIAWGCLAAYLCQQIGRGGWRRNPGPLLWSTAIALFVSAMFFPPSMRAALRPTWFSMAIALAVVALATAPKGAVAQLLSNKVLGFMGMLSYSLYLWQQPFFDPRHPLPAWFVVIGLPSMAIASYYLIEKRFLGFKSGSIGRGEPTGIQPIEGRTTE